MRRTGIAAVFALAFGVLAGCSQQDGSTDSKATQQAPRAAQLDQIGLIAAVGSSVGREYPLDDGTGFSFRSEKCGKRICGPDFSLEFRTGRVNVYWEFFRDGGGKTYEAMNAENLQWASQVLTYALGDDAAKQILESQKNGQPIRDRKFLGKSVGMSPGETSTLVQIFH